MSNYFPNSMLNKEALLSCEEIASKLSTFYEQAHLYHLQTSSYAEHMALGGLYECIGSFKDGCLEQLMGYKGMKLKAFKIDALKNYSTGVSKSFVQEIQEFSHKLIKYGKENHMPGISAMAEELSGKLAKTAYLLTLT